MPLGQPSLALPGPTLVQNTNPDQPVQDAARSKGHCQPNDFVMSDSVWLQAKAWLFYFDA